MMRSIIMLSIFASIRLMVRGQLNFKGNPLTENTEYTAEETHFSERNARRDYERFEIIDGRMATISNDPFTSSPSDDVVNQYRRASGTNDKAKKEAEVKNRMKESSMEDEGAPGIGSSVASTENIPLSGSKPGDTNTSTVFIRASPKASVLQPNPVFHVEARQLRDYPVQSPLIMPYRSTSSQASSEEDGQSQPYRSLDQSSNTRNLESYPPSNPTPFSLASGQALNTFLKSRTPEESQMALQHYFKIREYAAGGVAQSGEMEHIQGHQSSSEENTVQSGLVPNQMLQQEMINSQESLFGPIPSTVLRGATGQISYSPVQQHAPLRWNQVGFQSRQDSLVAGPGRRAPLYRGQMAAMGGRLRGKPWSQSRIGPGPPGYHHKGTIFGGPPAPPAGPIGKWKPPVQVIYTRPPAFGHGPLSSPIPYDDASRWFPDADGDHPPPQKDVLYSQLYAQSYDPHYYNYIAKTGKIKPWLYGKLGETKEKSIWWELFSGFKKHGMKNIMNPMFLLGMTIPTLTLMLTALVQKRSFGRSSSGDHVTEELVEEYARRLREAIECNEKRVKNSNSSEENKCW